MGARRERGEGRGKSMSRESEGIQDERGAAHGGRR
jgi:hypothetical protein